MNRRLVLIGVALAAVVGSVGAAQAGGDTEVERPIPNGDVARASEVALDHVGEGRVTGTEVDDEESWFEVEVRLDDGREVDVQLDEQFNVVGAEPESTSESDGSD